MGKSSRKRKRGTNGIVSNQILNDYVFSPRSRKYRLDHVGTKLMEQALRPDETEVMWEKTVNCTVTENTHWQCFQLRLIYFKRSTDKKGTRRTCSKKYKTRILAENDAFLSRGGGTQKN